MAHTEILKAFEKMFPNYELLRKMRIFLSKLLHTGLSSANIISVNDSFAVRSQEQ